MLNKQWDFNLGVKSKPCTCFWYLYLVQTSHSTLVHSVCFNGSLKEIKSSIWPKNYFRCRELVVPLHKELWIQSLICLYLWSQRLHRGLCIFPGCSRTSTGFGSGEGGELPAPCQRYVKCHRAIAWVAFCSSRWVRWGLKLIFLMLACEGSAPWPAAGERAGHTEAAALQE